MNSPYMGGADPGDFSGGGFNHHGSSKSNAQVGSDQTTAVNRKKGADKASGWSFGCGLLLVIVPLAFALSSCQDDRSEKSYEAADSATVTKTETTTATMTTTVTTTVNAEKSASNLFSADEIASTSSISATEESSGGYYNDNSENDLNYHPAPLRQSSPSRASSVRPSSAYANCKEARAAGAAPVYAGSPGYGPHLDRDGDGIGCE